MTELRARIGYSSVAFVTELLPRYFYQIAPDGVLLSLLTLQITEHTQDQLESIHEQGIRAVESFATAGADVIIMGGAPTNIAHGKMNLERALEELTQKIRPACQFKLDGAEARPCRRRRAQGRHDQPGCAPQDRRFRKRLTGRGHGLLGRKHANAKLQEYNRIPPQKALELGRELMREHPDIDTLIYGCPHWATIESIEPLEQEFGVNVITALQAIIWEGMRLAGVNDRVEGYGKLFREH